MDRSAIKQACKQKKAQTGVYRIKNSRDGIVFVGFSVNLPSRINRHKAELKFGSHRNRKLQEKYNAYGESAFEFEILEVLDQEEVSRACPGEDLRFLAEMWVEKLKDAGIIVECLDF